MVEQSLKKSLTQDQIIYEKCDTGDLESVRRFAAKVKEHYSTIHVLINNGNESNNKFYSIFVI
jgi:NAD(P)-dependent dehydrogenase (short-subunit alcohol dehydrogenase family)